MTCIEYILNYIYENNMYKKLSIMVLLIKMYKNVQQRYSKSEYMYMCICVFVFIIVRIILLRYFRMKMVLVVYFHMYILYSNMYKYVGFSVCIFWDTRN
jgi:hypothetical protein